MNKNSSEIKGQAVGGRVEGCSELGDSTQWSANFFGLTFHLRVRVISCVEPTLFSEQMVEGFLSKFSHRYELYRTKNGETCLRDFFEFETYFGKLFPLFDEVILRRKMTSLVVKRLRVIKKSAEVFDSH